jgi:hypothetical protein
VCIDVYSYITKCVSMCIVTSPSVSMCIVTSPSVHVIHPFKKPQETTHSLLLCVLIALLKIFKTGFWRNVPECFSYSTLTLISFVTFEGFGFAVVQFTNVILVTWVICWCWCWMYVLLYLVCVCVCVCGVWKWGIWRERVDSGVCYSL